MEPGNVAFAEAGGTTGRSTGRRVPPRERMQEDGMGGGGGEMKERRLKRSFGGVRGRGADKCRMVAGPTFSLSVREPSVVTAPPRKTSSLSGAPLMAKKRPVSKN